MALDARTLTNKNVWELVEWCGGKSVVEHDALDHDRTSPGINVPTKDGVERASLGDMIVQQNDGTFEVIRM